MPITPGEQIPPMAPVAPGDDEAYEGYANTSTSLNTAAGSLQFPRGQGAPSLDRAERAAPFLVREQARDGNCLFRSFSDQVYGTPDHHALLRNRCSQYLDLERNYFEQFVAEPFDAFLLRIQREGEWGDDVEIEALSEIFDCSVQIYASHSHTLMRTFHETCDAKWGHPVRLQYEGHSHYNSLAPRSGLIPISRRENHAPGEMEAAALARAKKRHEAGQRRAGAAEADIDESDRQVLDESIRLSRMEFEHKSDTEMDQTLAKSRMEWEKAEQKRMDEEVVNAMLQQSVMEEEQQQLAVAMKESKAATFNQVIEQEQKQMAMAMRESKEMIMQEDYALYGKGVIPAERMPGASSSSANEQDDRGDAGEYQYPESVYGVMSMGFPLEKCIQAYHLVGDNPEGILAYCCQTIGR